MSDMINYFYDCSICGRFFYFLLWIIRWNYNSISTFKEKIMTSTLWLCVAFVASAILVVLTASLNKIKEEDKRSRKMAFIFVGIYISLAVSSLGTVENYIASNNEKTQEKSADKWV